MIPHTLGFREKTHFLRLCPAFRSLDARVLGSLAESARSLRLLRGQNIVRQGDEILALTVLTYGDATIWAEGSLVARISAPGIVGDQEILTDRWHAASTVTVDSEYSVVLEIPKAALFRVLESQPDLGLAFVTWIASRTLVMESRREYWRGLLSRLDGELLRLKGTVEKVEALGPSSERPRHATDDVLRFVVEVDERTLPPQRWIQLTQGYLAFSSEGRELRLRRSEDACWLAGKRDIGERTISAEVQIEREVFDALLPFVKGRLLRKRRCLVTIAGREWVIDIFNEGTACAGLSIAEVTVPRGEEIPAAPPGVRLITDVTRNEAYRNRSLALHGPPANGAPVGA